MLSILIPVYNWNVVSLVQSLYDQCKAADVIFEIIVQDDASEDFFINKNKFISEIENVEYLKSNKNEGRAETRMKLAKKAKYSYLLFIDADASVLNERFVQNYLSNIPKSKVICGGHKYSLSKPEEKYVLHWAYGNKIEAKSAIVRKRTPYNSFSTFNYCIDRNLFLEIGEQIKIKSYGHEDTLLGYLLNRRNITIKHIENPLQHEGLKERENFLLHTKAALDNAISLYKIYPDINISIIKKYHLAKQLGLILPITWVLRLIQNSILTNIHGSAPKMIFLQLYKLTYLIKRF